MEGGCIYWAKGNRGGHPIIFLNERDADFFAGVMLTHSSGFPENIQMQKEHFEEGYQFKYSGTHFVAHLLLKKYEWSPFILCGKLTDDGLNFVKDTVARTEPILWQDYKMKKSSQR